MYRDVEMHIAGAWVAAADGATIPVINPATGEAVGTVPRATVADLDRALEAAARGFAAWRKVSVLERSQVLRRAAALLRERSEAVAVLLTTEQGKPLHEARLEIGVGADTLDWFAEEARRAYGRVIPARVEGVQQLVLREPVGPVAAFTPWNFPIIQGARKLGAAIAVGCSIILKGSEEVPASTAALVRCLLDAGLPGDVVSLVYGVPADISAHLIAHPVIRKVSFTGSTAVGKQLAALAGAHMKRVTMELGGHAPVLVFDDADIETASRLLVFAKYRNAGQVCINPTRFLVHEKVVDAFTERFVAGAAALKVGDGMAEGTEMGPLANDRRVAAVEALIADATAKGAAVATGGARIGNKGCFFAPTVLTGVTPAMRAMNEEPFGPVALVMPFRDLDAVMAEANRLPYGLASYAFTGSAKTAAAVAARIEAGMITINHLGIGLPEAPFGGVKDSGYGSEGGSEAIEPYLATKFVTRLDA